MEVRYSKEEWDPEFTKLTSSEEKSLQKVVADVENGEYVTEDEIDWN